MKVSDKSAFRTPLFPGGAQKYFFMKMLYNWFE
jgi:hypothetical protein